MCILVSLHLQIVPFPYYAQRVEPPQSVDMVTPPESGVFVPTDEIFLL